MLRILSNLLALILIIFYITSSILKINNLQELSKYFLNFFVLIVIVNFLININKINTISFTEFIKNKNPANLKKIIEIDNKVKSIFNNRK
jgi:hypothetical protein